MSSTDSAIARKVDDILRNQWTIYFGFSGRHAPDLVDDMLRIMQLTPHWIVLIHTFEGEYVIIS